MYIFVDLNSSKTVLLIYISMYKAHIYDFNLHILSAKPEATKSR